MAKRLVAFDFDNTLAVSTARVIVRNRGKVSYLSPYEYANYKQRKDDQFDFSEFDDVNNAIAVKTYMDKLRLAVDNGDDVVVVTARGRRAGKHIARYLRDQGIETGVSIRTLASGKGGSKKNYMRNKINKGGYTSVEFYDDHPHNVESVAQLQREFPNIELKSEVVPEKEYKPLIKQSSKKADPTEPETRIQGNYKRQGRIAMNLDRRVRNPVTGNDILVRTALRYPKDSQVYQIAKKTLLSNM